MTTLTVIAEDRIIIVDGELLRFDFGTDIGLPENVRAIQWNGSFGHIEYSDGQMPEDISDEKTIKKYIAAFTKGKTTKMKALEELATEAELLRLRNHNERLLELAQLRWEREIGGIVLQGMLIDTDRESQGLINGAVSRAMLRPESTVSFKTITGAFVSLDAETIKLIGLAVGDHVQACYAHEGTLATRILELKDKPEELAMLDLTSGWPETILYGSN